MKPREKKPEEVFRVVDRETGEFIGSYSRSYCTEFDFSSAREARATIFDDFRTEDNCKIARYRVIYQLIEDDC